MGNIERLPSEDSNGRIDSCAFLKIALILRCLSTIPRCYGKVHLRNRNAGMGGRGSAASLPVLAFVSLCALCLRLFSPTHQQIHPFIFDFLESQPLIQFQGRIETLDVDRQ
jgi:hypothetical protein